MPRYSYITNTGKNAFVDAPTAELAIKTAPNIGLRSGVQLESDTTQISPTSVLTADNINPSLTPTIPTPVQNTDNYSAIIEGAKASLPPSPTEPVVTEYQSPTDSAQQQSTDLMGRIKQLYGNITGKSAYEASKQEEAGIPGQQKDIQELTNKLNQISAESQAAQINLQGQGRGIPTTILRGQAEKIQRQAAIDTLITSSQLHAKQGNLNLALNQIQRAVDLKYKPMEDEIKTKEQQLSLLDKYVLQPSEAKRKNDMQAELTNQKDKIARDRAAETEFNKNVMNAQEGGMNLSITSQARDLYNAGRIDEANSLIAPYSAKKASTPKVTAEEKKSKLISNASQAFESVKGKDGYINPNDWIKLRRVWLQQGGILKDFTDNFSIYQNPSDTYQ